VLEDLSEVSSLSKPLLPILLKELLDQVLGMGRHLDAMLDGVREVDLALLDEEVHPVLVSVEERRHTYQYFI
jgi:hypothetical protein